ncbi:hypothetical protein IQ37_09225 [Chryseobacterium piperi]|uniref:Uncharacterized protein n=1 Tax=Chryseobacterium piperi TaxID=558152 RepID=A0A086BIT1_9FLAO|nr:tetratricopeptide repeat protein [Chryseobacterium piperi]ASW73251.2 tetratricopeptide repeat-containing protein [Chryseobacterium piperi]KFF28845.1 hypothetical protein IQ37_09225 [Chryseobacterium piperi]
MHNDKILKTSIFFIVFFIFYLDVRAQNSSREIDSISQLLEKNYRNGDTNPGHTLKNATILYYLSREKKFYPGQINSIFEEVKLSQLNGDFDSALTKINEGIDLARSQNDYNMVCRILLLYQKVLLQLDHLSTAKHILERAESYNHLVKNKEDKLINGIYITLAKADLLTINESFDENRVKEVIKLKKQAYSECLKISDTHKFKKATVIYTLGSLADSLACFNKIDEAKSYLDIIDRFLISFPDDTFIIQNLITKGVVEKALGNYPTAIGYFSKAIADSEHDHNRSRQNELYSMLADTYDKMKDFEKATSYSKKYMRLVDSVDLVKKKSGDVNFINKINLKVSDNKETRNIGILNVAVGVGLVILAGLAIFFYRRKSKNKKNEDVAEYKVKDEIQDDIRPEKYEPEINMNENNSLNTKSENTKELILLAKEDINAFYIEFQKVYPHFYTSLKNKYPDLNISDINFCSLVKMNFGIKEISQYTNSTIRAAEARRYRINKKMELKNQNELYMVLSSFN